MIAFVVALVAVVLVFLIPAREIATLRRYRRDLRKRILELRFERAREEFRSIRTNAEAAVDKAIDDAITKAVAKAVEGESHR